MHNQGIVYSFDVFDTCLVRACGPSYLVFEVLARKILGNNADISQIRDFALLRIRGEKKAKEIAEAEGLEDTTLDKIYENCDFSCLTQVSNDEILKKELEVETALLLPVFDIANSIEEARKVGNKIIFITDMYLSSSFIKGILTKYGILKGEEPVYVSGEIGKTKRTGSLFDYVKRDLGVDYSEWRHFGDNKQSDYRIPRKLGIKAKRIKHEYSYYEKEKLKLEFSNSQMEALKLASISKAIRLSRPYSPYNLFSSDFVAPIYVSFVYGVLLDEKQKGINKLFFLARDGFIFYEIAKQFLVFFPNIKISYLYVSRVSLYLPGLKDISYESLAATIEERNRDLLTVLEYFKIESYYNLFSQYSNIKGSELLIALLDDERFVSIMRNKHKEQRDLCLAYFEQEGLFEGQNAVVDLVGTRRCQTSINRILTSVGKNEVFGYYFDVVPKRIFEGDYKSFNFGELRSINSVNAYYGNQGVFEQYFSITNQGRTIGYERDNEGIIQPIKEEVDKSVEYADTVLSSNIDCCKSYCNYYYLLQPMCVTKCGELSLKVYSSFCYNPRKEYLAALAGLRLTSVTLNKYFLQKKNILGLLTGRESFWIYGDLIYNSGSLYRIMGLCLNVYQRIKQRKQINRL